MAFLSNSRLPRLHPSLGSEVLAHLRRMAELPLSGVVAGQAVASAIDDLWGPGGGVYNDIDVFIPVVPGSMRGTKAAEPPTRFTPRYVETADYGAMQRFLRSVGTYQLETTVRRELVNRVYISLAGELRMADHGLRVISSFDLNCCRVAVDIRSGRLTWDHHYEAYLRTRQLRIVTVHTPAHTFLRLLKKRQELPGVSVDLEAAAQICFVTEDAVLRPELRARGAASYVFGEKYRSLAAALEPQWSPYYELDAAWLHLQSDDPDEGGRLWKEGAGDETSLDAVSLHTLRPRGFDQNPYVDAARQLGPASVVLLPSRIYAERDAYRCAMVNGTRFPVAASREPGSRLEAYSMARGYDYLKASAAVADWVSLNEFLARPSGEMTYGMTAAQQHEVAQRLRQHGAALGVPDGFAVMLDAFDATKVLEPQSLFTASSAILERERALLHREALVADTAMCLNPLREPIELKELRTLRELREATYRTGYAIPQVSTTFLADHWRFFLLADATHRSLLACRLDSDGQLVAPFEHHSLSDAHGLMDEHHFDVAQALKGDWVQRGLARESAYLAAPL